MASADNVPPVTLCSLCSNIFAEPRKKSARYDIGQTYSELEISAKSKNCQLCYMRWMQRLDVEEERPNKQEPQKTWTNLQYHINIAAAASPKIYFDYTDLLTKKKEVDQFVVLPIADFPRSEQLTIDVSLSLNQISSTGSPKALAQVYSWYQQCKESHMACRSVATENEPQPTRLIYLGCNSQLEPRLVETRTLGGCVDYCTLSHSWGQHRITCLTRDNFAQFKVQVPSDAISKSFHDAMLVAKHLGISYIWIDSLCIIQKDLCDWQHESLHMSHVYKNAICNIGATSAKDGSVGCFSARSEIDTRPCWVNIWVNNSVKEVRFISDFRFWRRHVLRSPLGKRGWIVQERHLARRMMHFTRSQIYWECRQQTASETFPHGLPEDFMTQFMLKGTNEELQPSLDVISTSRALQLWVRFVRDYSSGNLTEERDKLVAISGLAKELARHMNSRYLAGLWEFDLPSMLLWRIETPLHTSDPAMTAKRLDTYQAPSWSWASLCDTVILNSDLNDRILISIVEAQTTPLGDDEFGQISSGFIKVSGYLAKGQVFVPHKNDVPNRTAYLIKHDSVDPMNPENILAKLDSCNISEVVAGQSVYCMPVTGLKNAIVGLLLEPMRRVEESQICVFRRLGLFSYSQTSRDGPTNTAISKLARFEDPCREFTDEQDGGIFHMTPAAHDSEGIPRFIFMIE